MAEFTTREPDWLSFTEALERILSSLAPLPSRLESLFDAHERAVAHEVRSRFTLPPGPTSHMDGFALRFDDVSQSPADSPAVTLEVVGRSLPGSPWVHTLAHGTAVRIMTGALLPPGADMVVPVEKTDRHVTGPDQVRIPVDSERSVEATHADLGRYIRPPGEEMHEGEILAQPGVTLDAGMLTLLAAAGADAVQVYRAPRIAILVTGSELIPHGDPGALEGGLRKVDVLSPTLPILVRDAGGVPLAPIRVPDQVSALTEAIQAARDDSDLILTTGGASMGDTDLVKEVLQTLGFKLDFWRIRMRPGSPVSFGLLPGSDGRGSGVIPVLGLPGNPVSALVTFLVLGRPAVRKLGGHRRLFLPRIRAVLREPLPGPGHLTRFFRVRLEPEGSGAWGAYSAASQGSGVIRSLSVADGLAVVTEGADDPLVGDSIEVFLLPRAGWTDNE